MNPVFNELGQQIHGAGIANVYSWNGHQGLQTKNRSSGGIDDIWKCNTTSPPSWSDISEQLLYTLENGIL